MKNFKRNLTANFLGRGWSVVSAIIFMPCYIKFLGTEAYGLVGFYTSLQGVLAIADMGLTATLNRELARLSASGEHAQDMRDTTRTIEMIYLCMLSVVIVIVALSSSYIATHWLNSKGLSEATLKSAVRYMGVAMIMQLSSSIFQGGLIGLQRQVRLNTIYIVMGIVRSAGVVLALWLIAPTLNVFFIWQALTSLLQVIWLRYTLWHSFAPASRAPKYRSDIMRNVWRYSIGMMSMTLTVSILRETDKIILAKMIPLEMLGYYTVAWTVSQTPASLLSVPVYQATFPRLTQYASLGDKTHLSALYHRASQMVSLMGLPMAILMVFFSKEVLYVWMGNNSTVTNAYPLLSLLAIGSGLLGILTIPSALALAYGWASLGVWINATAIVVLVPLLVVLIKFYGAMGGCISWVTLNVAVVLIFMSILHRRLLIGEQWRWYFKDVGMPLVAALVPALLLRKLLPDALSRPMLLICLIAIWIVITIAAMGAAGLVRELVIGELRSILRGLRAHGSSNCD